MRSHTWKSAKNENLFAYENINYSLSAARRSICGAGALVFFAQRRISTLIYEIILSLARTCKHRMMEITMPALDDDESCRSRKKGINQIEFPFAEESSGRPASRPESEQNFSWRKMGYRVVQTKLNSDQKTHCCSSECRKRWSILHMRRSPRSSNSILQSFSSVSFVCKLSMMAILSLHRKQTIWASFCRERVNSPYHYANNSSLNSSRPRELFSDFVAAVSQWSPNSEASAASWQLSAVGWCVCRFINHSRPLSVLARPPQRLCVRRNVCSAPLNGSCSFFPSFPAFAFKCNSRHSILTIRKHFRYFHIRRDWSARIAANSPSQIEKANDFASTNDTSESYDP